MRNKPVLIYLLIALISGGLTGCKASGNRVGKPDSREIKILSYNVRNARGMDEVTDYDRVARVIKRIDADCVAIQELDSATVRSNGVVVLEELARRTGMYASYSKSIDYQGGGYGVGVLTKEKPIRKEIVSLPGSEEKRSLLLVELPEYVIGSTHWSLRQPDRLASADTINNLLQGFTSKPVFLAGDLNAVPASEEIGRLSKKWTILNDTTRPTIPVTNPTRCIDYVLMRNNPLFSVKTIDTKVENEPVASDHLPVWVSVFIQNQKNNQ